MRRERRQDRPMSDGEDPGRRLELLATILLAAATVATAWSGYQASRWNGEQAKAFSRAGALRIESAKAESLANTQTEVDVATFSSWIDALAHGETKLAEFYARRFRPEFQPAVRAWQSTKPLTNPNAPLTPFRMPQYKLAARAQAQQLEAEAETWSAKGRTNVQRATNYVLGRRAVRERALLRGHLDQARGAGTAPGAARVRRGRVPRHGRVARDVPGQLRRLTVPVSGA